jgi:hypothetical protein
MEIFFVFNLLTFNSVDMTHLPPVHINPLLSG